MDEQDIQDKPFVIDPVHSMHPENPCEKDNDQRLLESPENCTEFACNSVKNIYNDVYHKLFRNYCY
jgi:hypothetical protein